MRRGGYGLIEHCFGGCQNVALDHEGALDVVLGRDLFVELAIRHGDHMLQIFRQLGHHAMALPTVVEIDRAIIILLNHGVDGVRVPLKVADERLANRIDERSTGLVAHCNADAPIESIGLLNVVGREEEILLTVEVNRRRRPDGIRSPRDILHAEHGAVLRPVNEVGT